MRFTTKVALVAAGAAVAWSLLRRRAEPEPMGGPPAGPAPAPAPGPTAAPSEPAAAADESVEGYCMKERKKVQIKDPVRTTTKDDRPAVKGTCPDCGSKIFRFLPRD